MAERARRPAGEAAYECWGEFLSKDNNEMALDLFDKCFDGVRIMAKFDEYFNKPDRHDEWVRRAEIAADMGKKIHLCIDWHNTASGPGSYHDHVNIPTLNKLPAAVGAIIKTFPRCEIVEVANEPYYVQTREQRITIEEYKPRVLAYMTGCDIGNHKGLFLASQSSKRHWKKNTDKVEDGWEWSDTRWAPGMLEGLHSAILHDYTNPEDLIHHITDHWYEDKAVGYQHAIYESELAPTGKQLVTDSAKGAAMYRAVLAMSKNYDLPVCYLTIGMCDDFGGGNNWPGKMCIVDDKGNLSQSAKEMYRWNDEPIPKPEEPPIIDPPIDPPVDPPDENTREKLIRRITADLDYMDVKSLRAVKGMTRDMKRLIQDG